MKVCRKYCVVDLLEGRRHAVNRLRGTGTLKMVTENNKRCNIVMYRERLRTVSSKKELMRQIACDSTLFRSAI